MSIFSSFNSSASALTAERFRMDVISSNIANAQTTRATTNEAGQYEPYRRKMVHLQPNSGNFKSFLHQAANQSKQSGGVKVSGVVEDSEPFKLVYNPSHPDADENGNRSEEHTSELQSRFDLVCRLLLEKK